VAFYDKYTGFLRRLKVVYTFSNIWNLKYLKRNKELYEKYGVKRKVWQSISSKHFANLPEVPSYTATDDLWKQKGYVVLDQFLNGKLVDEINNGIQSSLDDGSIDFNYTQRKIHFAYKKVPVLKEVINHPGIIAKLEELVGDKVLTIQSINLLK
jgi:hypothetical protein